MYSSGYVRKVYCVLDVRQKAVYLYFLIDFNQIIYPKEVDSEFLRNVGTFSHNTAHKPKRKQYI